MQGERGKGAEEGLVLRVQGERGEGYYRKGRGKGGQGLVWVNVLAGREGGHLIEGVQWAVGGHR